MTGSLTFLDGGGKCAEVIRRHAWERTSLGPIAAWPASLRATVANMLHTRQPMLLFWGPELIQFYNDAFVPSFGFGKHPTAMGQSARVCWQDAWPVIGAQIDAAMRGEPAWFEDALVPIHRNGRMEEVFWTYSYSPAHGDAGEIVGTLVIVTETTARVLSGRRLDALAQLGRRLWTAASRDAVLDAVAALPSVCPQDVPFLAVLDGDQPLRVAGIDRERLPPFAATASVVPLANGPLDPVWHEPFDSCFVTTAGRSIRIAFGLSPRLPFDAGYRSYLTQIAERMGMALVRA